MYDVLAPFKWSLTSHGHPVRSVYPNGKQRIIYMRRVVMGVEDQSGFQADGVWVQTKNRNGLDCRRENLVIRRRYEGKWRETNLWRSYRITLDDYNRMLAEQGGACAICRIKPDEKKVRNGPGRVPSRARRLAVDHDEATGVVRGLLCTKCNTGIGMFDHDSSFLASAIEYLRTYEIGRYSVQKEKEHDVNKITS